MKGAGFPPSGTRSATYSIDKHIKKSGKRFYWKLCIWQMCGVFYARDRVDEPPLDVYRVLTV